MSKQYLRLTLLEDAIHSSLGMGVDWSDKGARKEWEIIKVFDDGDMIVEHNHDRALITKAELEAGYKEVKPNWSVPTGMKFKIEPITKLSFWERLHEALPSKAGLGGQDVPLPSADQQHKEEI